MKAPIAIGVAICAAAGVLLLVFEQDGPDISPAAAYLETAASRVRETMRDNDAKIENAVFHPIPGPGPTGRSYACGYARSSTANNARSERFIYHFGPNTVSFVEQIRDGDQRANAVSLCNSAALPLDKFDLSDDRISLKTNR
jgi:hypothetical protein